MKIIVFLYLSLLLVISCSKEGSTKDTEILNIHKSKFDSLLVRHFPDKLNFCEEYKIISDENSLKNSIGMLLYCYEVDEKYLDSITIFYENQSLAKYKNSDSCLLVINRFENIETFNTNERVYLDYNTRKNQNKECFSNKFPIPKFLSYRSIYQNKETYLPDDFMYYVLEAKPEKISTKYDLIPNPQMPTIWENGFSRGVAINEKSKEIIFWGVIW